MDLVSLKHPEVHDHTYRDEEMTGTGSSDVPSRIITGISHSSETLRESASGVAHIAVRVDLDGVKHVLASGPDMIPRDSQHGPVLEPVL